jgi:arginyl-tRNA---protein transferase
VLENSLSSVYFFYDPDYKKYSLGVYGVIQELNYMKEMQKKGFDNFKTYYLGYYI